MANRNYLIGRGELLTEPVPAPARKPDKAHPYTPEEARVRLAPQLAQALEALTVDSAYAPDDVHVMKIALHPSYVAKSYYPATFLRSAGLEPVGSRDREIKPAAHVRLNWEEDAYATSEIYVAGRRSDFERLSELLSSDEPLPPQLEEIREVEEITNFTAREKVREGGDERTGFELVVHLPSERLAPHNRSQFLALAGDLDVEVENELGFEVRGLWFLPAVGSRGAVEALAEYSTVRVVRPMPSLSVSPVARGLVSAGSPAILPPPGQVVDSSLRVAILDGGLPNVHAIGSWIDTYVTMNPGASNATGYEQHGLAVASAYLFGPLTPGVAAATPPSKVSVFRVLDESTASEHPFELYRTLGHIEEVLLSRSFDFVNLSLGPTLPLEDDDVHAWTSLIDDLLSDGETLLTVAVGNNGENDWDSGNARVQVPSDSVNALAVGAADISEAGWARAPYSAIGPGRSPGRFKPDILAFGGTPAEYFHYLADGPSPDLLPGRGTSLAAPLALRHGASIRALLGAGLSPLAIRALLIHSADDNGLDLREVGWGRVPTGFQDIVTSGEGVAKIVYQGEVRPGKYIRATVPTPATGLDGKISLSATFCFASPVDVQSPDVYTRAGLEVVFRPDVNNFKKGAKTAASRSFFTPEAYANEARLRAEQGKWETVLHASDRMLGSTLADPAFDIHYNARDGGSISRETDPLKYALVITLDAPKVIDLHASILEAYPGILVPIEPTIEIDLTTQ